MSVKNKIKNTKDDIQSFKTEFKKHATEFKKQAQEIKSEFKKQTKIILRHFRVLQEDSDSKIKLIAEQHGSIVDKLDQHTVILENHTEMIGSLKEDMEIVKQDVGVLKEDVSVLKQDVGVLKEDMEIVKQDVGSIKHELTQKVDRDEFIVLEKRVGIVELKL